ncbi:hypothetical protein [Yinghuangia soli]|uniref:Uncharacterized protein n=1 Tax=Yinghuangia soli TaxID=2908204 RepID=A0AA41Q836_9ACTN|nr:hypothetical protein [Yinghuangia soli]MCF2533343.1 hypothetical protein [Yinghuangia soli]
MAEPILATDDQLRRLAAERTDRWIDETDRRLRSAWDHPQALVQPFAAIPEQRRPRWRDLVQQLARTGAEAFRKAAVPRRTELAAQAFALLRAAEPRLTDRDVMQQPAPVKTMVDGLPARTEAGAVLAALAAAGEAATAQFIERAPVLDDLRAAKTVELGVARDALRAHLAPFDQAEAHLTGTHAAKLLPLLENETAAGVAARAAVPDVVRVDREAERGVRDTLGKSLGEQYRALAAPFNAANAGVQEAMARLAPASASYGAMLAAYEGRWIRPRWGDPFAAFEVLFGFYGLPMLRAILAIPRDEAIRIPEILDPTYDRLRPDDARISTVSKFCRIFPQGTGEQVLLWAFTEVATITEPDATHWVDAVEAQLKKDPVGTPWPAELGPRAVAGP